MTDDMDINCGDVLDGVSIEDKGQEIFDKVLRGRVGRAHQIGRTRLWRRTNSCRGRSARSCSLRCQSHTIRYRKWGNALV